MPCFRVVSILPTEPIADEAIDSQVNARKKALLPVVRERQTLADGLARYLAQLGLHRRVKATSINDLLSQGTEEHEAGENKASSNDNVQ